MRTLFFKIFFGFCVVVVLVGTSLETSSILANYFEVRWQMVLHSIMPMEAEKCARIYEQSGRQAVEDYLDDLQKQKSVRFYFFDEDGNSLLDRGAPELILKLAKSKEQLNRTAALTFDRKNHRIQFEERSSAPMTTTVRPRAQRYGIRFRGFDETPLKVVEVDPGSPADRAGVRSDDVIVALDGTPIEELCVEQRMQKLKGSPLVIRVKRDLKVMEIKMSLE